jgi:hypothetical protein
MTRSASIPSHSQLCLDSASTLSQPGILAPEGPSAMTPSSTSTLRPEMLVWPARRKLQGLQEAAGMRLPPFTSLSTVLAISSPIPRRRGRSHVLREIGSQCRSVSVDNPHLPPTPRATTTSPSCPSRPTSRGPDTRYKSSRSQRSRLTGCLLRTS